MAELTWRNVDAPSSAEALTGLELSNRLFNKALASGQSGIDQIQQMQRDAADRAVQARMAAITDPAAYQAAMQQGLIVGPDAQNASMAMLEKAAGRGDVLVDNATDAETLRRNLYENQRGEGFNAADDAFASEYGNWQTSVKSGKLEALDALTSTDAFKNLSLSRQKELTDGFRTAVRDKVGLDSTLQSMRIRANEEARAQKAAAEAEQRKKDAEDIQRFIIMGQRFGYGENEFGSSFAEGIQKGTIPERMIPAYAQALAGIGVKTPYGTPVFQEDPLSTGDPVQDELNARNLNLAENQFKTTISEIDTEISKLGFTGGVPTAKLESLLKDKRSASELTKALVNEKGGKFEGASEEDLTQRYHSDMKKYVGQGKDVISPALYFEAMKESLVSTKGWQNTLTNTDNLGLPNELELPESEDGLFVTNLKELIASNNGQTRLSDYNFKQAQKASYEQAKAAKEQAVTQLANAVKQAKYNPEYQAAANRAKDNLAKVQARFDAIEAELKKAPRK